MVTISTQYWPTLSLEKHLQDIILFIDPQSIKDQDGQPQHGYFIVWDKFIRKGWELSDFYHFKDSRFVHTDFIQGKQIQPENFDNFEFLQDQTWIMPKDNAQHLAKRNGELYLFDIPRYKISNHFNPKELVPAETGFIEQVKEYMTNQVEHVKHNSRIVNFFRPEVYTAAVVVTALGILVTTTALVPMLVRLVIFLLSITVIPLVEWLAKGQEAKAGNNGPSGNTARAA